TYPTYAVEALLSQSTKKMVLGLHYTTDGVDFLVGNVFALGTPILLTDRVPEGDVTVDISLPEVVQNDPNDRNEISTETPTGPGILNLAQSGFVTAEVFDVMGRKIRTVVQRTLGAGTHDLRWDGTNSAGTRVPAGIYFYRIQTSEKRQIQKVFIAQ
ncbi:MAG: T9SS type A sorting domain-containing protein, partial [Candidatus Eisenbacteria bacterium]|nr:T9SS type A sorting domain-containing protein [Candidatus Eisenbacteria bacterium]